MKQFVKTLQNEVETKLCLLKKEGGKTLQKTQERIVYLQELFVCLKTCITGYDFKEESPQIPFFEKYKPSLACHLFSYRKKYIFHQGRPSISLCVKQIRV